MAAQMVFERYEKKYILDRKAVSAIKNAMAGRLILDKYGKTTIANLYFDSEEYKVIQSSMEATTYKAKLRVRSYGRVKEGGMVFVELKKKYEGIVYKRRVEIPEFPAMDWLCAGGALPPIDTREKEEQPNYRRIGKEIDDFRFRYGDAAILPRVYLSYEREAYAPVSTSGEDIRITFDTNILARDYDLSLRSEAYGEPVLDPDFTVMEVKIPKFGSMPIWLCRCLSENCVMPDSFSKYGTYFRNRINGRRNDTIGGQRYA